MYTQYAGAVAFETFGNINECERSPCLNSGYCLDLIDSYRCHCTPGYEGFNCETDIDECTSNPCLHGSTCRDLENDYLCVCQTGYIGDNCQLDINDCLDKPCYNNATCIDGISKWTCVCLPGFTGENCKIDINECHTNPCKHGGTCKDMVNDYTCVCANDSSGYQCEKWTNHCSSSPCLHSGICINQYGGFTCNCVDPWFGEVCEKRELNSTQTCIDMEYTDCSCFIHRLNRKPMSNKLISGTVGFNIGLLLTIAAYCACILCSCHDKQINRNSVNPVAWRTKNRHKDSFIENVAVETDKCAESTNKNGNIKHPQRGHHNCFTDHTGFDFLRLYRDKNGTPIIPRCRHFKS